MQRANFINQFISQSDDKCRFFLLCYTIMLSLILSVSLSLVSREDVLLQRVRQHGGGSSLRAGVVNGVRGLVLTRDACAGDVLLEVPLTLTICDTGESTDMPLPGSAPQWTSGLPWNVQLALTALERRSAGDDDAFLSSWPSEPPALPQRCDAEELALASDRSLELKAEEAFFWLDTVYWEAREAHDNVAPLAAADGAPVASNGATLFTGGFPSAEAFNGAMEFVWSRCLRLSAGVHGVRRLLVPYLDLANHEAVPSCLYAFSSGASCGPAIRLHAARALRAGDEATITYGEHNNAHFALYYGFVPSYNPFDSIDVTIGDVLSVLPPDQLPAEPEDCWPQGPFALRADGPDGALLAALTRLLPPPPPPSRCVEAAAARAVASLAAAIEQTLWGGDGLDSVEAGIEADEQELAKPSNSSGSLSDRAALLVRVRLSRRRLLASVRRTMLEAAEGFDADPEGAAAALSERIRSLEPPSIYPALDALPVEELTAWESQAWDWEAAAWRRAQQ